MSSSPLLSQVTGSVWEITAQVGQTLAPGDTVMVLESMKMEIPVLAEVGGVVTEVNVAVGDVIQAGHLIAIID